MRLTRFPAATTSPRTSIPGTYGNAASRPIGQVPARTSRSDRLTAAAMVRIDTSVGPTSGIGSASTRSTAGGPVLVHHYRPPLLRQYVRAHLVHEFFFRRRELLDVQDSGVDWAARPASSAASRSMDRWFSRRITARTTGAAIRSLSGAPSRR